MALFEANGVEKAKVYIGGNLVAEAENITIEEIKKLAKQNGISKFYVEDSTGYQLEAEDFPLRSGSYKIVAFFEAK